MASFEPVIKSQKQGRHSTRVFTLAAKGNNKLLLFCPCNPSSAWHSCQTCLSHRNYGSCHCQSTNCNTRQYKIIGLESVMSALFLTFLLRQVCPKSVVLIGEGKNKLGPSVNFGKRHFQLIIKVKQRVQHY